MSVVRRGDWARARRALSSLGARLQRASDAALLQEAHRLRAEVVEGIRHQAPGGAAFTPLAPTTLAVRAFKGFHGKKALIRRGDLRNAISVVKVGRAVFIGVLRTAVGRDLSQPLVNVAEVMEYGAGPYVLRLTPKAKRFLHAALAGLAPRGGGGGVSQVRVRIPPRPFLAPMLEGGQRRAGLARRFIERVARQLFAR